MHQEFQGLRITPNPPTDGFALANVYTTHGELDRFCDQMEFARNGLPP
ncbi:MAG TPA: hypothetical protein VGW39_08175 [Chthoniobacterales bacterium]|nr:hypothetical protein [Chthoniobacterales bacterium]